MALPDYVYNPLEDVQNDIRLLEVYSSRGNDPLRGYIRRCAMKDTPPYIAISYCWGVDSADKELHVWPVEGTQPARFITSDGAPQRFLLAFERKHRDFRNYRRLKITANVELALRSMFARGCGPYYVWIDSICINQKDDLEKGHQVKRMSRIYKNSKDLYIWLGDEYEDSNLAFDLIRMCYSESLKRPSCKRIDHLDYYRRHNHKTQHWRALSKLIQRPWFSRRWIIQELTMSRHATVFCGRRSAEWLDLDWTASYFMKNEMASSFAEEGGFAFTRMMNLEHCAQMVKKDNSKLLTLGNLLRYFGNYQCSNPKDRIYSLLSLASDVDESWVPEYTDATSMEDLLMQTFKHIVESEHSLDALSYSMPRPDTLKLPSWLPNWQDWNSELSGSVFSSAALSSFQQFNILKRGASYSASGTSDPRFCIGYATTKSKDKKLPLLELEGYEVDIVRSVSKKLLGADSDVPSPTSKNFFGIPEEWLHMASCGRLGACSGMDQSSCAIPAIKKSKKLPESFWRTMVGNRIVGDGNGIVGVEEGRTDPTVAPKECGEILSQDYFEGYQDLEKQNNMEKIVRGQIYTTMSIARRFRFFATTETSLGWVPLLTRPGDAIYIISGCSVPMILRPVSKLLKDLETDFKTYIEETLEIDEQQRLYVLIGECYVHGLMEGEFIENNYTRNGKELTAKKYYVI